MDESGLAHKKRFTVKLVLCPGQEFEGVGPSIKKAQQMAAQVALQSTTLPRLFSHARCNRNRPKGLLH
jgi:dsRNA-specific ribonuclease